MVKLEIRMDSELVGKPLEIDEKHIGAFVFFIWSVLISEFVLHCGAVIYLLLKVV